MISEKMKEFDKWLQALSFPLEVGDLIQVLKSYKDEKQEIKDVCFYTSEHKYKIFAIDRKDDDGYLGCMATVRKPRAGEDWSRGNDLPDGPFNIETWNNILKAIVRYELVKLSNHAKHPDQCGMIDEN